MRKISIEISNKHLHLTKKDYEKLFNEPIEVEKQLSVEGEFASKQKVNVDGLGLIRILGPFREKSQLELSLTDARKIKQNLKLRHSGNLEGTSKVLINTELGEVLVSSIIAKRHMHVSKEFAIENDLSNNDLVSVKVEGERGIIFNNVLVKIYSGFSSVLHLDTDEGNAAGISEKGIGILIKEANN